MFYLWLRSWNSEFERSFIYRYTSYELQYSEWLSTQLDKDEDEHSLYYERLQKKLSWTSADSAFAYCLITNVAAETTFWRVLVPLQAMRVLSAKSQPKAFRIQGSIWQLSIKDTHLSHLKDHNAKAHSMFNLWVREKRCALILPSLVGRDTTATAVHSLLQSSSSVFFCVSQLELWNSTVYHTILAWLVKLSNITTVLMKGIWLIPWACGLSSRECSLHVFCNRKLSIGLLNGGDACSKLRDFKKIF